VFIYKLYNLVVLKIICSEKVFRRRLGILMRLICPLLSLFSLACTMIRRIIGLFMW